MKITIQKFSPAGYKEERTEVTIAPETLNLIDDLATRLSGWLSRGPK